MINQVVQVVANLPPLVYVVAGLATLLYFKTRFRYPSNIPPVPVKPYPVVGHIPLMSGNLTQTLNGFQKSVGDIFSLYVGSQLYVVLNSFDVIKEGFVKKGDYLSDRPISFLSEEEKKTGKGTGIVFNSGSTWKEQRTVSVSILRNFGMGKNWLAEKISEEVEAYLDILAKFKGEPTDVKLLTNTSVSNVICTILIGNRFELDDPYLTRLLSLLNYQISLTTGLSAVRNYPWLRYIPGDYFNLKKMDRNRDDITNHFSVKFINEKDSDDQAESPDCFINAYNNEMRKKEEAGESTTLDKQNLIKVITNLFAAGSETTSTTLLWAMLFALHYPECQKKINKEIEEQIGSDRIPNIVDKLKMPYTSAFIMETQRLGSIVPLSVPHTCSDDVEVAGYTIPRGTTIIPNLDAVLKDPETWGDPLVFRPERFLDEENKVIVPEQFIPFSIGRRFCMGESLARAELFLYITGLFQRFHFQAEDPDNLPSLEPIFGLTQAPQNFKIKFIEKMGRS